MRSCLVLVLAFGVTSRAAAAPLALRANVSAGLATSRAQDTQERAFGRVVGGSVGLGVTDLAWVQLLVDHTELGRDTLPRRITTFGAALVYTIDVGSVTPFLEAGVGAALVRGTQGRLPGREIVPVLGLGVDGEVFQTLRVGVLARYWPLFDSALLQNPALTLLCTRVSFCTDCR